MSRGIKHKITFVFDMPTDMEKYWRDGLFCAIELLKKDFEIEKVNLKTTNPHEIDTDFVLGWGAFNSPVDQLLQSLPSDVKKGLCIGGYATPTQSTYNVLFYETPWSFEWLKKGFPDIEKNTKLIHAFGINSKIYSPKPRTPKIWDVLSVGAFAYWKRQNKMIEKTGNRLVVGEIQKGNIMESMDILGSLALEGVAVSDMVSPEALAKIYNASKLVFLPADIYGGSERSTWEAISCGIPVEICDDNPKLKSLIDFGVKDHYWYAEQLKSGIISVL